jgi:hypothetical protein
MGDHNVSNRTNASIHVINYYVFSNKKVATIKKMLYCQSDESTLVWNLTIAALFFELLTVDYENALNMNNMENGY